MDEHKRILEPGANFHRCMVGQEPAATDAEFRVTFLGAHALDQFRAGPDAAGILPAAAAATKPFAQNRAGGDEPAFGFGQLAGQRLCLTGCAHAGGNERGEQVGGDSQPGTFGDIVDAADDFKAEAGADGAREQCRQGFAGTFDAGRNNASGNDGGFQQAEIIAGEIENFVQVGNIGSRAEVDAGEAQDRFVNDAQVGFDRRPRGGVAAVNGKVDGNVEDPRAGRMVHAKKENIAPAGMRQIHADRGGFAQDRKSFIGATLEQFRPDAERLIGGMADAEHPLIAADGADAAADLIGERLKTEVVVGDCQRTGEAVGRAVLVLRGKEGIQGFVVPAIQQVFVAGKGDETLAG